MSRWTQRMLDTSRGKFEVFIKGEGAPLCVAHLYSEFNETGDYFAETFTDTHRVYLVNLREAGNSVEAHQPYQLSMLETVFDLEGIREALGYERWGFAGHSTGGMLGVVYGIYFSEYLTYNVIVGAAAREYMTFSPECIYHEQHPQFELMQKLIEILKSPKLSSPERSTLAAARVKLSLFKPDRYEELFSLKINKTIAATRMNYFNRELQVFDVTRKLSLISTPSLIVCGKYDVQCPVSYSVEMSNLIPNATLRIFNESNHYPFLEEALLFKEEVNAFLEDKVSQ